ncbi:MAG: hypothetical protein ACT4OP_03395 [Actinomycetota bacterium]
MPGRRLLSVLSVVLAMVLATAASAKPPATTTVSAAISRVDVTGSLEVTEDPAGNVTLDLFAVRTTMNGGCTVTETWDAAGPAVLAVANNLSSATATATFAGGHTLVDNCGGSSGPSPIGQVLVDALATAKTDRLRTEAGVRIVTRTAQVTVTFGSVGVVVPGEIEKTIG